ncbi:MAG TPA: amidohydrolase family protein [Gammaproteobacteria bacterium]|nr:amidohydrolase family protein [Gammaproteobacteria bacterium]
MSVLRVVDFHSHLVDSATAEAVIPSLEETGVAARVISAPLEFHKNLDGINDSIAEVVSKSPRRVYGLASVDAYTGEAAAAELERSVKRLGLRGVFMESAKGALLPDAPQARPLLAAAAELGVPVLLHPVADPQLFGRFKRFGRLGGRLTRSTINSAALFALLTGGVFEALPGLKVVVTALAFGGLVLAAESAERAKLRHVYVDTTGMNRIAVRGSIEILGAGHVLVGTDWPVAEEKALPATLEAMFDELGLDEGARRAIAGENALRLMAVG